MLIGEDCIGAVFCNIRVLASKTYVNLPATEWLHGSGWSRDLLSGTTAVGCFP